ncbi:MAG: CorA family divalent cation transporter, partial [Alphaproteobacteria bacterium]|nr:CorA family divalent cation transporter [Alphaproteobacteria bacterium]
LRRRILELRRYVAPQREALTRASAPFDETLDDRAHAQFGEIRERTARLLEDLEVLRDRTQFIREEIADRRNDKMNRAMYSLSLVAGLFLPLGFVTGLLGINVGGMPGVDDRWAFWIVCVLIVLLGVGVYAFFKNKRWL